MLSRMHRFFVLLVLVVGCKSKSSDAAPSDAASMPLNVRAEVEALCEAAASAADPNDRASCGPSMSPREGAKEEIMLRLRDDEVGAFLYFESRAAYDAAVAARAPSGACAKSRILWRYEKVPQPMAAKAAPAIDTACGKATAMP
jgi:hypothetical protein